MNEAIVAIGENKRIVGRLRFEADGRRQHSQFEYYEAWLSAKDAFALSPILPLRQGGHYASGSRGDERNALHGCFSDASPDSWGRALMSEVLGRGLTEFDYLTQADDKTRQGALRFLGKDIEPLVGLSTPIPRLIDLNELRALSAEFERDGGRAVALRLAGLSGSLGGARPKANVESNGKLWIAKFTSQRDIKPVVRVEVATLKLAEKCSLHVSNARLELPDSDRPVALVASFFFDIDRNEARKVAKEMAEIITRNWRNEMKSQGMSSKDLKLYEPAFEHDDTEAALAL